MAILVITLLFATTAASFAETYAFATYRSLVRGSHPRFVWRTAYITLCWTVIVLCVALAVVDVVEGDVVFAGVWLAVAAMRGIQLHSNRDSDDDDWWKGRGRKIWAGVKRRVASLVPKGVRVPQPVMG
jgi:Mn2+/Fe2+ NRAMP family transporter